MEHGPPTPPDLLEWGVATRALAGQPESGDRHLVEPFPGGALLAVVDGLGHGEEAAEAARAAVAALAGHAGEAVTAAVERCHRELRNTRGVVIGVASFDAAGGTMTWLGVGDVDGVLVRAQPGTGPRRE